MLFETVSFFCYTANKYYKNEINKYLYGKILPLLSQCWHCPRAISGFHAADAGDGSSK